MFAFRLCLTLHGNINSFQNLKNFVSGENKIQNQSIKSCLPIPNQKSMILLSLVLVCFVFKKLQSKNPLFC
jgi:hypothetical protein